MRDADGPKAITGIALAYESMAACSALPACAIAVSTPCSIRSRQRGRRGPGLGLDRPGSPTPSTGGDAISRCTATRRRHLSMWKGVASGNAARNGMFAALLAAEGITGPRQGDRGIAWRARFARNFELGEFGGDGRQFPAAARRSQIFLDRISLAVADYGSHRSCASRWG